MMEYRSRQELRSKVIDAFSAIEEVYRIDIFGKEAAGKDDQYSDIDMIVSSNNPLKTWRQYREIFNSVAPVVGTLSLGSDADFFAEMLLLEGYSPYQKVDFSIGVDQELALPWVKTVYDAPHKGLQASSTLPIVEIRLDVNHHLSDLLFSIPRFTKCLFRQDIDLYRRLSGTMNKVLVLMYEYKFGWQKNTPKNKLLPYETERLMAALSGEEKQQLYSVCPPDGRVDAACSFTNGVDLTITLSREKARSLGMALNEKLIETMQSFLHHEIERFQSQRKMADRQLVIGEN